MISLQDMVIALLECFLLRTYLTIISVVMSITIKGQIGSKYSTFELSFQSVRASLMLGHDLTSCRPVYCTYYDKFELESEGT